MRDNIKRLPHIIAATDAATLDGLLRERVGRSPQTVAYRAFDQQRGTWVDYTWEQIYRQVARWQAALKGEGLQVGDRVAVMLRNSVEWVIFDQAALGLGLIVVPIYTADRPDNVAYCLRDAGVKLLLIEGNEQWTSLQNTLSAHNDLFRIVSVQQINNAQDSRLKPLSQWLSDDTTQVHHLSPDLRNELATIIYTSGTTGKPKGVMLSHYNILSNAEASLETLDVHQEDVFLSFLPLSHTFERTVGYYLTIMSGSTVAFARSISQLSEDLQTIKPTLLISVPRIYERVNAAIRAKLDAGPPKKKRLFELAVNIGYQRFEHSQGRLAWQVSFLLWPILKPLVAKPVLSRLGGRLRAALCGGAALSPEIAKLFIGLGLPVLQGYGLTEASPVVSANRLTDNVPASVGTALNEIQVSLGDKNALLVKGPNVMLGYWNNPQATQAVLSADGWLNTGDTAHIDEAGHIFITGRLKDIIVMSNGEKIPPVDMENAILRDSLFEQVMLIGEGKPYLSVIAVLNQEQWNAFAQKNGLDANSDAALQDRSIEKLLLERVSAQLHDFPGYAQVRRATFTREPWTPENDLLTSTLKLRRAKVLERYRDTVERLYQGH